MKCQGCGHDYPSTLTRCTKCGRQNPRRTRALSDSRLIEFPRQPRSPAENTQSESALPAWRLELNERVRQVKARRNSETASGHGREIPASEVRNTEASLGPSNASRTSRHDSESNGPIVEAALSRVRRANREAVASSHTATAHASSAKATLALDREATARALETAVEPVEMPIAATLEVPKKEYRPSSANAPVASAAAAPQFTNRVESRPKGSAVDKPMAAGAAAGAASAAVADWKLDRSFDADLDEGPIEEIDPLDYLEAEIKKVDRE